jgi:hypothetical protein
MNDAYFDNMNPEHADICRLMGLISNADRLTDIAFCAAMFKQGQLEGTEVFGVILHKTWSTPVEQELFDKMLALFMKTPEPPGDVQ